MKKKQPQVLNFIISLEVYPFQLMVSMGETDEDLHKKLNRYNLDETDIENTLFPSAATAGRFVQFSCGAYLIRKRVIPSTPKDFGNLQHEIFHVVATLMERIGQKLIVQTSDESYAYLVGFITEKIYSKLNVHTRI